jgi:2-aminoadipate transaminase
MGNRYLDLYSPLVSLGAPPAAGAVPPEDMKFNFGQGLAAPETFPLSSLRSCSDAVFDVAGVDALEYFDPSANESDMLLGFRGLRESIADWILTRQGRDYGAEGIILTLGSAQGLSLMANTFVGPGDGVIVEETTFRCALHFMRCAGGVVSTVPIDDDGMNVDAVAQELESFARRRIRPKVIYTIPTFHLPTGTVLSEERRTQLLALAEHWNVLVLEDNVYGELRYGGTPVPSLASMDQEDLVVQSDSFSKMIAPGIRIGWLAGPPEIIDTFAAVRQDLGISQISSRMMDLYMRSGELPEHLDKANVVYRRKRDAAVQAMEKYCSEWATYRIPDGSFYLWVEMDSRIDWNLTRDECRARGVYYRAGETFATHGNASRHFRLAFSYMSEDQIEEGIAILGEVVNKRLA